MAENILLTESEEQGPLAKSCSDGFAESLLEAVARRLADVDLPQATYRVQFNAGFTFRHARELVPYWARLGISHVYASPFLKAGAGSTHGYDVVDHTQLNPELGTEADFEEFVRQLHEHGLGLILDVVPNHMGVATNHNVWWLDVLENGPSSPYASFFDIDWMPLKPDLAHKVLLPVLGDQFGKVLEDQQLVLTFEEGVFGLSYYERRFPIAVQSWSVLLKHRMEELEQHLGAEHPHLLEYHSIVTAISHLPPRTETNPEKIQEGRREKEVIKRRLNELAQVSDEVRGFLAENVRIFNGTRGEPRSFDLLDRLLLDQAYRLSYWRVASDEINYRRFFDVNELAAVCMENPLAFEQTHRLIFQLVASGQVDGLRIDHPDGLYNPLDYFLQLQRTAFLQRCRQAFDVLPVGGMRGDEADRQAADWAELEPRLLELWEAARLRDPTSRLARPLYVVVEKIIGRGERLPDDWPVHGTTGYEFLNTVNGLSVDASQAKIFEAIYSRFIRERMDYADLMYRCKRLITLVSMSSELSVLGHQLDRISEQNRWSRDFTLNGLTRALREVIACFPVYRTYISGSDVPEADRHFVDAAVARAKRKNTAMNASIFDFVRDILLLKYPDNADEPLRAAQRQFVGKFQQVTGPVMAKGVEDTAFYIENRLVSLNDVGGDPERFGTSVAAFHQQCLERQNRWPHALLTTSTHDTKRGEDVRARINVLSEMSREWRIRAFRWARWNSRKKADVDGNPAPSRNDEYLLYQTLIGTWPLTPQSLTGRAGYVERISRYMLKAAREAKVETSWINPNEAYERALEDFITKLLADGSRNVFLNDFEPFARQVASCGVWNSLSQTLLKLTAPGVPDLYQGSELWHLCLVDPDNRQPVDFAQRRRLLTSLLSRIEMGNEEFLRLIHELIEQPTDGRLKLFTIFQALSVRHQHPDLWTTGSYVPLEAVGNRKDHLCAFARLTDEHSFLIVVPRLSAQLTNFSGKPPIGTETWGDTWLPLPDVAAETRYRNVLTGETLPAEPHFAGNGFSVAALLQSFPIALLEREPTSAS